MENALGDNNNIVNTPCRAGDGVDAKRSAQLHSDQTEPEASTPSKRARASLEGEWEEIDEETTTPRAKIQSGLKAPVTQTQTPIADARRRAHALLTDQRPTNRATAHAHWAENRIPQTTPRASRQSALLETALARRIRGSSRRPDHERSSVAVDETPRARRSVSETPQTENNEECDLLLSFATPAPPRNPHHRSNTANILYEKSSHLLDETPRALTPGSVPRYSTNDLEKETAELRSQVARLESALRGQRAENEGLGESVRSLNARTGELEQQMSANETRHRQSVNSLAQDLHAQYSEKHSVKVRALKASYEAKYGEKIRSLEQQIKSPQPQSSSDVEHQLKQVQETCEKERERADTKTCELESLMQTISDLERENERVVRDREEIIQMANELVNARQQEEQSSS